MIESNQTNVLPEKTSRISSGQLMRRTFPGTAAAWLARQEEREVTMDKEQFAAIVKDAFAGVDNQVLLPQ